MNNINQTFHSNPSCNLTIQFHEEYRNIFSDDYSINGSISFERSLFYEVDKIAIDKHLKKKQAEKKMPNFIT